VVGERAVCLFVCDKENDRLQVFSLAGEHRRSITGEWVLPLALCLVKDRLYLVEEEDCELVNPRQGRRIFILSLAPCRAKFCRSTRIQSRGTTASAVLSAISTVSCWLPIRPS